MARACSQRSIRRSIAWRIGDPGGRTSSADSMRTRTPLLAARRSCARTVRLAVSDQRRGSQLGCSPICSDDSCGSPAIRASAAKKAQRRPLARAWAMKRWATSPMRLASAMGAPATTQAAPVSL